MEFDARKEAMKNFMKLWNEWRDFYFHLPPLELKTAGQITAIEGAIDFCKQRGLDLNLVIACLHKSYEKSRTMRPAYHEIKTKGEERYHQYLDAVESDIEMAEIERLSLDG